MSFIRALMTGTWLNKKRCKKCAGAKNRPGAVAVMEKGGRYAMELKGKKDYQDLLLKLLEPLKKYISPGGARIRVPGAGACYSRDVIEMEAFARPLWGLVPFWAGGRKRPGMGGYLPQRTFGGNRSQSPGILGRFRRQ